MIVETVEKPFNGVILSEAKNLTQNSFETLHFVQGEIVDFVNNLSYTSPPETVGQVALRRVYGEMCHREKLRTGSIKYRQQT